MEKRKLTGSLKLLKDISRTVESEEINDSKEIERIRRDVEAGMRVGFFIKGQPYVARRSRTSGEIEVVELDHE